MLPTCSKISVASNKLTGSLEGACRSHTPWLVDLGVVIDGSCLD